MTYAQKQKKKSYNWYELLETPYTNLDAWKEINNLACRWSCCPVSQTDSSIERIKGQPTDEFLHFLGITFNVYINAIVRSIKNSKKSDFDYHLALAIQNLEFINDRAKSIVLHNEEMYYYVLHTKLEND